MTAPRPFTSTPVWREYVHHLAIERQRRPATIHTYANTLDRWGRFLGRRDWRQATSRDLGRFLAQAVGQGQHRRGQLDEVAALLPDPRSNRA